MCVSVSCVSSCLSPISYSCHLASRVHGVPEDEAIHYLQSRPADMRGGGKKAKEKEKSIISMGIYQTLF